MDAMDALRELMERVNELAGTNRNLDFQISIVRVITVMMITISDTLNDARNEHETNEHYVRLYQNVMHMIRDLNEYYQYLTEEEILVTTFTRN